MCNEWFASINLFPMCHLSLCPLHRSLQTKVVLSFIVAGYNFETGIEINIEQQKYFLTMMKL